MQTLNSSLERIGVNEALCLVVETPGKSLSPSTSPASEVLQYVSAMGRAQFLGTLGSVSCGCESHLSQQEQLLCWGCRVPRGSRELVALSHDDMFGLCLAG